MKGKGFYIASCYIALIFLIAVLPINPEQSTANTTYFLGLRLDYVFHILFFIPWMSFTFLFDQPSIRKLWFWFLGGLLFAACAEGLQYFTPYRSFNFKDLMSNTCGLILGCVCLLFLKHGKRKIQ